MCTNILQFDPRNESDRAKIYSSHRVAHLSGGATCETCIARPYWMNGGPVYLERKCEFLSVSTCCTSTQSCNERSCCLNANRVVMLIRNLSRSPFFFCLFYSSLSVSFFSVFQSSFYFSLLPPPPPTWLVNYGSQEKELPFIRGDLFQFPPIPPCYCAIFP